MVNYFSRNFAPMDYRWWFVSLLNQPEISNIRCHNALSVCHLPNLPQLNNNECWRVFLNCDRESRQSVTHCSCQTLKTIPPHTASLRRDQKFQSWAVISAVCLWLLYPGKVESTEGKPFKARDVCIDCCELEHTCHALLSAEPAPAIFFGNCWSM